MKDQELEIKLWMADIANLEQSLVKLGAQCIQPRVHELNLRYDTPDRTLTRTGQALRLRQDIDTRLTYKGPGLNQEGVHSRREIEFSVSDFDAANAFLLALGYQESFIYEKYRTVYQMGPVQIMIDELPYGNFIEIEAPTPQSIQEMTQILGLNWEERITDSYAVLFDRLKLKLSLPFRDLTFKNFSGIPITAESMGVRPADV